MCKGNCKLFEVSSDLSNSGIVKQTCKVCHKETELPGTMTAVINWMRENQNEHKEYKSKLHYIEVYFSKQI
jgi:hypothetical protein